MNNYTENNTFDFENNQNSFGFNPKNGLDNSYENEEIFNSEVKSETEINSFEKGEENRNDVYSINPEIYSFSFEKTDNDDINLDKHIDNEDRQDTFENNFAVSNSLNLQTYDKKELNDEVSDEVENSMNLLEKNEFISNEIDAKPELPEEVETQTNISDNSIQNFEPLKEESNVEEVKEQSVGHRPIELPNEDLSNLTEFEEEKIETSDIKSLFDRVGVNVKEASDIFKRNTEMKEKLDSRFEELKKLQLEVSKNKQEQYDEINSYKDEVLEKLNEKKQEIEKRLNKLKEFQATLEKEKQEFEQYKREQKEEIEKVQKEVQDAYDGRREELRRIEDVLRKQRDNLDEERSQLSLDKIQYESDKNELANNLLKFNEIVDSFTKGIDKLDKE